MVKNSKNGLNVVLLTLLIVTTLIGQKKGLDLPIDDETNKITYSEVVHVDTSLNIEDLFSQAREWFAKTYNSSKDVIQMEDKEDGIIVGKARHSVTMTTFIGTKMKGGHINYTISIYTKNGRYKYKITDFYHTGTFINSSVGTIPDGGTCEVLLKRKKGFWNNSYRRTYESFFFQTDEHIKNIIADLKVAMSTKPEEDEW